MNKYLAVAARLLLAQIFLVSIIIQLSIIMNHPTGYDEYQIYLGQYGLPGIFAPLMILIQLGAGAALFLGFKTKISAIILAIYAVFVALTIKLHEPIQFMQYMAIAGGMLMLVLNPVTACSLDNLKKK